MLYYNTLLLHKIEKIKIAGSIREMSSEMGDNHNNFDLFRLENGNGKLVNAPKSQKIEHAPVHTIRVITRPAWNAPRTDRASASSRLCLGFVSALPQLRLIYASITPWLRSPANIIARRVILAIVATVKWLIKLFFCVSNFFSC